jgi:hypothetical protein
VSIELMSLVMKADLGTVAYMIPTTDRPSKAKKPRKREGRLGTFDKHLLLVLADRGNPDGRSIYPSVEWMAKAMGASESSVHESLLRLKGTFPRILVVEKDQVSRYSTLHYRIMVPALERVAQWKLRVDEQSGVRDADLSASRGARGGVRGPRGGVRGARGGPDTSVEPSVEPSQSKATHQKAGSTSRAPAAEKPAARVTAKRLIFEDPKHQATADLVDAQLRDFGSSRARAVTDSRVAAFLAAHPEEA